jgi:hypothetical protein
VAYASRPATSPAAVTATSGILHWSLRTMSIGVGLTFISRYEVVAGHSNVAQEARSEGRANRNPLVDPFVLESAAVASALSRQSKEMMSITGPSSFAESCTEAGLPNNVMPLQEIQIIRARTSSVGLSSSGSL